MCSIGPPPNVITFTQMMNAAGTDGKIDEMLGHFEKMSELMPPDAAAVTTVAKWLGYNSKIDE